MENRPLGAGIPQPPVPPEVERGWAKSRLRAMNNRASLLPILMQVFALPVSLVLVFAWIFAHAETVRSLLQRGGAKGLVQYFYGNGGLVILLTILATCGAMAVTVLAAKPMLKQKIFGAWKKPRCGPGVLFAGMALLLGAAGAGSLVVNLLTLLLKQAGAQITAPDFSLSGDRTADLILAAYVCLIGPVLEETLFRGMILQSLRPWGDWFAIVASSVLFGMFHLNLVQAIPAALMGLVLGFAAVEAESVLPAVLLHIFNNSLSMAVMAAGADENRAVQVLYGAVVAAAVIVSALLIAAKHGEASKIMARPASAPPVAHKYAVFFFQSAAFWVLAAFFCFYSLFAAKIASGLLHRF
jgi:membrane protease YdiL (CAAX protease family)